MLYIVKKSDYAITANQTPWLMRWIGFHKAVTQHPTTALTKIENLSQSINNILANIRYPLMFDTSAASCDTHLTYPALKD